MSVSLRFATIDSFAVAKSSGMGAGKERDSMGLENPFASLYADRISLPYKALDICSAC